MCGAGRLVAGNGSLKTTDRKAPRHPYEGPKPPQSAYKRSPLTSQQKPTAAPKGESPSHYISDPVINIYRL